MSEDQPTKSVVAYTENNAPYGDLDTKGIEQAAAQDLPKTLEQIETEPIYDQVDPKSGKSYRYTDETKTVREYPNGRQWSEVTKKFLKGAPKDLITKETAKAMQAKAVESRLENRRRAAIEGMDLAISDSRKSGAIIPEGAETAWGYAVGKAMLAEGERNQVAALRLAAEGPLELIGKRNEAASPTNGQVSLTLTGNVSDLRQVMGNRYAQGGDNNNYRKHDEVIDVQVTTPHEDADTEQNK